MTSERYRKMNEWLVGLVGTSPSTSNERASRIVSSSGPGRSGPETEGRMRGRSRRPRRRMRKRDGGGEETRRWTAKVNEL